MKKQPPLVCQHLENISRDVLEKYQAVIRECVRNRQGIYALYRRKKLYYVGLASNLRSRLRHHLRDRHGGSWDRFSVYLTIGDSHLRELEALILRIVKVPGNKQKGKFVRSEDLRRHLSRDIREHVRQEVDQLLGRRMEVTDETEEDENSDERAAVLATYISRPMKIRGRYKSKLYNARVRRDGMIRFQGELFSSPSAAGIQATNRSCNGWKFWHYERAPGDWVPLDTLRR